jgi:hypothetical protein
MALLSRADPLTGKQEQQMFNSGLLDELCFDVEMHKPCNLEHTISLDCMSSSYCGGHGRAPT